MKYLQRTEPIIHIAHTHHTEHPTVSMEATHHTTQVIAHIPITTHMVLTQATHHMFHIPQVQIMALQPPQTVEAGQVLATFNRLKRRLLKALQLTHCLKHQQQSVRQIHL